MSAGVKSASKQPVLHVQLRLMSRVYRSTCEQESSNCNCGLSIVCMWEQVSSLRHTEQLARELNAVRAQSMMYNVDSWSVNGAWLNSTGRLIVTYHFEDVSLSRTSHHRNSIVRPHHANKDCDVPSLGVLQWTKKGGLSVSDSPDLRPEEHPVSASIMRGSMGTNCGTPAKNYTSIGCYTVCVCFLVCGVLHLRALYTWIWAYFLANWYFRSIFIIFLLARDQVSVIYVS